MSYTGIDMIENLISAYGTTKVCKKQISNLLLSLDIDITPEQMVVVYVLNYGPLNSTNIANICHQDSGIMDRTLDEMATIGLIERKYNEEKADVLLQLTKTAKDIVSYVEFSQEICLDR
jgi:DNA-binding MarR family transcriptional regulator